MIQDTNVNYQEALRRLLEKLFVNESEFEAFCIDYFPEIYRKFPVGASLSSKQAVILENTWHDDLYRALRQIEPRGLSSSSEPIRPPQPPRSAFDVNWYVDRPIEQAAALLAISEQRPIILSGCELSGKTWLLQYLLNSKHFVNRNVCINLRFLDDSSLSDTNSLLKKLTVLVSNELHLDPSMKEAYLKSYSTSTYSAISLFGNFIADIAKAEPSGKIIFAIDNADVLAGRPQQDEFFSLLRSWATTAEDGSSVIALVLSTSVPPALLINNPAISPFNIVSPIEIGDFDTPQVLQLAKNYNLSPTSSEIQRLRDLVGGQPYLVRLALYASRVEDRALNEILASSESEPEKSIFGSYLGHLRRMLIQEDGLYYRLQRLLADPEQRIDIETISRLTKIGLLRSDYDSGKLRHRLKYKLYDSLMATAPIKV